MSGHTQHLRPCPRLHSIALSTLSKSLQRAFYVVGKRGFKSTPRDRLQHLCFNHAMKWLCEKDDLFPLLQIQNYLSPRLPAKYRQELFDEVLEDISTPEFDSSKLFTAVEFEFRAHDTSVCTSDMNNVMQTFLKCLLLGYVTKLDFSALCLSESCWVARARQSLSDWKRKTKNNYKLPKECNGKSPTVYLLPMWKEMGMQLRQAVAEAAISTAPAFHNLATINVDYMATGELIWEIAKQCPLLQDLSLFMDTTRRMVYSKRFEDDLISSLSGLYGHKKTTHTSFRGRACGCSKLQRLVLPIVESVQSLYEIEAEILRNLSRMKEIRNGCTTRALEIIFSGSYSPRKPFSLTHIEDTSPETEDYLHMLQEKERDNLFPKVTSAKVLQDKESGVLQILLSGFPKMKILEVYALDELLESSLSFPNVTHFKSNCKWDQKKLVSFSRRAPNLEVLVFTYTSISRHKNFKDSMSFPSLRAMEFYGLTRADIEPFHALLKGTRCLTHLIMADSSSNLENQRSLIRNLTDKVISNVLPSLKKLVVFHAAFLNCDFILGKDKFPLTMKSVKSIMHNCGDLKYIGCLYQWDIAQQDISALKEQIKRKNWDLHLDSVHISTQFPGGISFPPQSYFNYVPKK